MDLLGRESKAPCVSPARISIVSGSPPGGAPLARHPRQHSTLAAVVLKRSRARKRYECQRLLVVEEQALQRNEAECLNEAEVGQGAAIAKPNG
jgi:hypothetical protein